MLSLDGNKTFFAIPIKFKGVAKFFMTVAVHKELEHGQTPSERLIFSGCGSIIEICVKQTKQRLHK